MEYVIEVKNLIKNFEDKEVLKDVTFHIKEGEIFGLLGPSGSGKTTIINILIGQYKQNSGQVTLFGEDNLTLSDNTYLNIGMVLDCIGLFERLTCYDNLLVFAQIHNIDKSRIIEVLELVHLEKDIKTKAYALSKGMRQRLCIARAILHRPKILFLDEPTSGLDPSNSQDIHHLVENLRRQGVTIFLTTHRMDEARKLCDHIAFLHLGKIIEYGKPEDICNEYNKRKSVEIKLKNGEIYTLSNTKDSAKIIYEYFNTEIIETIHSTEPDLGDVFLDIVKSEVKK